LALQGKYGIGEAIEDMGGGGVNRRREGVK
jgi:hypothetical protein